MALWAYEGQATFANELVALLGLSFTVWNLSAFQWGRERHELTITLMGEALLIWGYVQQVAMGLKRVFDILDLEPSITERENAIPLVGVRRGIQFHDVEFSYEPPNLVLKGVNLQAAPGSIVAIVGPSGAGKSTLVSLLLRLFDPDKGSISIDGRDLRDYSISSLRQNIAIALQENLLFGTTVRENIVYAAPNKEDEAVADALEIACLNEIVDQLPKGLNTSLGDRGARLSTGQKQRISIARAVLRDAQILILDEPTSSLDAETEQKVLENLRAWAQTAKRPKRTIFLITHRLSTIRHADSIAYLHSGTIAEHGEHKTLMQIEGGRYRSFVAAESSNFQQGLGDA
jgi:ABC-type multidrug transport system fused ATPase/permease subunit